MPSVMDGIIKMNSQYIKFPYTLGEQDNIKRQFAVILGTARCFTATAPSPESSSPGTYMSSTVIDYVGNE